ncbi:MAG TPA: methyltransferase domain-containing protein, partial [Polyangia bacterium]|nr:methyltransferase domain-containing protein [Polyangia bacterium]
MSARLYKDPLGHRLPLYAYLEPVYAGRRVLEVGCGVGAGAEYLLTHGAERVVGIDTDPAAIEQGRARLRRPNLDLRLTPTLGELPPLAETFDLIMVPDAEALIRRPGIIGAWKRLLADGGRLVVSVANGDRARAASALADGGVGYYEIADALGAHFPRVRMFGQTPFLGFGMIEFEGAPQELHVDSRLIDGGAEPATRYLAVGGTDEVLGLGYALVQVPFAPLEASLSAGGESSSNGPRTPAPDGLSANERRLEDSERRMRSRLEEAEGRVAELRRRVDDATAQSDSALRITRAQGEEIEELRGRLRRAAEDRAALDGEIAKLRRALADADELVLGLTRKTAEEMTVLTQRLRLPTDAEPNRTQLAEYAALRDDADRLRAVLAETEARASAAEQRLEAVAAAERDRKEESEDLRARLRRAEETAARERREVGVLQDRMRAADAEARRLEEREEALSARDERIARLEGEKQDLTWRLAELEEKLRVAIARVVAGDNGRGQSEELIAARTARERTLEEFHRAAGAHVDELTRLKTSVAEQTALVNELEEALKAAEAKVMTATNEAASLRKGAKELEEADRARRSRLAELEGKLLRLEHEKRTVAASVTADGDGAQLQETARKLQDTTRERDGLRSELESLRRVSDEDRMASARARAEVSEAQARASYLEGEIARLSLERQQTEAVPNVVIAPPVPTNGSDLPTALADPRIADELREIEDDLKAELHTLATIESTLQTEIRQATSRLPSPPHLHVGSNGGPVSDEALREQSAEVILLHTTLASFRRRAARLRDETEGLRRRIESLSASEISGFLEELGEDLA